MGQLEAIYAIWLRELKIYLREKERIISSLVSPLLWLFAFGGGVGAAVSIAGVSYQQFIFPGIIVMATLFTAVFYGTYIVWDKKLDFLKAVLVAPISRFSMVAGKLLGGLTDALLQTTIVLLAGFLLLGMPITLQSFVAALLITVLIGTGLVALGLTLGANMSSPEAFTLVMTFIIWPLFFFSGALYPLDNLPAWLGIVTIIDPVTYGVDLMRGAILGVWQKSVLLDLAALIFFDLLAIVAATISFGRMQQTK